MSYKTRSDLHLNRKVFHFLSIFGIFLCMVLLPRPLCWALYIVVGIPAILLDFFRHRHPKVNKMVMKVLGPVLREHESRQMAGSSFTVMGVGLAYLIFPLPVSQLAVLFLALGDPVASFFGLLVGKKKLWRGKSLEGSLAALVFCSLAAFLFFQTMGLWVSDDPLSRIGLSTACGTTAAIAEMMPISQLDDNLTLPLVSGGLMWILFSLWGGLL
ncbi:MAG: hypothetical protein AAF203_00040 [Pseudomonadota bacterium]